MTAVRRRVDDRVSAALAIGVAGLFFFNLVFGPLAIALGAWATHRPGATPRDRTGGRIAVAVGVADLLVLAALVALRLHHGTSLVHVQ